MEDNEDKTWASKYLLDPLTAPAPAEETGPGSNHVPNVSPSTPNRSSRSKSGATVNTLPIATSTKPSRTDKNPFRIASAEVELKAPDAIDSRRGLGSTNQGKGDMHAKSTRSGSIDRKSSRVPNEPASVEPLDDSTNGNDTRSPRERRKSSLSQRHPGDLSHRPLDMLKASEKAAQRAPSRRKKHHVGADSIDTLDLGPGGPYHHEGPYDATLLAKNLSRRSAPVDAVRQSNIEALRATPREKVQDSIDRHYPLDGVAALPPGIPDPHGRILRYREGDDMMVDCGPEGGAYKRWPGLQYHPSDLKGKGEPSYSIERALKDHRRNKSDSHADTFEMQPRQHGARRPSAGLMPPPARPGATSRRHEQGGEADAKGIRHRHQRGTSLQNPRSFDPSDSRTSGIDAPRHVSGESYADWQIAREREKKTTTSASTSGVKADSGLVDSVRKRVTGLKV